MVNPMTTTREEQRDVVEQPYCAVTHAVHLKAVADRMHGELLQQVNGLMNDGDHSELSRIAELVADYEEVRWDIEKTRPLDEILNAVERVSELEAEIDRLRASQAGGVPAGWMDISTAPKDGTYVDIWGVNPAGRRFPGVRWTDWPPVGAVDGFTWRDERGVPVVDHADAVATNWMALPSAPGAPPPATDGALESEGLVQATVQGNGSVTLPVCQWQPIETAPKDGTWVLGFRPTSFREDQIDTWQFVHRSCDPPIWINSADSNDEDEQPTHWMPLPLPPDDRTNGSEAQSGSLNQALPASSVSATDAVEAERQEYERGKQHGADDLRMSQQQCRHLQSELDAAKREIAQLKMARARGTDEVGNG